MNSKRKGRNSSRYARIIGGALFFLSAFSHNSFADEKQFDVRYKRQDYKIVLDEDKFNYRINPEVENYETSKEVLASAVVENLVQETRKRKEVLEEKIEDFIYENPSTMDLQYSCKDVDFKIANETQFPTNPPKLDIIATKEGNKLELKFSLDSQDYVMMWGKDCSIIIGYPKDTRITRRVDKPYEIDFNSKNKFERNKTKEVSLYEEREVGGMLVESIQKRITDIVKQKYGLPAQALLLPKELEEWLGEKEKDRREEKIKGRVQEKNWREYQPTSAIPDGLQSRYETARKFSVDFFGKPERIDFFVNSYLRLNEIDSSKEITSLKENRILLKAISAYLNEPTEKTTVGKIVKRGRTIDKTVKDILGEYDNHKLKNLDEKEEFYYKLKLWNSQIYPFVTLMEELKEKQLKGGLDNVPEYRKFEHNVKCIQEKILPLESILIIYNEEKKPFTSKPIEKEKSMPFKAYGGLINASDTNQLFNFLTVALECYKTSEGSYPEDLQVLVTEKYISELESDRLGNKILYRKNRGGYVLKSAGRDLQFNTDDDITRINPEFKK